MKVAFRVDASVQIGTGHLMRCLTLADALKKRGAVTRFICRYIPGSLARIVEQQGHKLERLFPEEKAEIEEGLVHSRWLGASQAQDALDTAQMMADTNWDWLVVDHYALNSRWESAPHFFSKRIMVIDDLADRTHHCDLLLDQNLYENMECRYDGLIPSHCARLFGPRYALLRNEFDGMAVASKRDGVVRRVLVFCGGSDPQNLTARMLLAMTMVRSPGIRIDVVVGALNPYKKMLRTLAASIPQCRYYCQVQKMAELMGKADLFLGAGGSISWERCAMGLPALAASIARNQNAVCEALAKAGAIRYLGQSEHVDAESIVMVLSELFANPGIVQAMAERAKDIADPYGVDRVVAEMYATLSNNSAINLRLATLMDREQIFAWRNAESTRRFFFDTAPISWKTHVVWFDGVLEAEDVHLLIGEMAGKPIGVLRYDRQEDEAVVSVYLTPGRTGQGIGAKLLIQGTQWMRQYAPRVCKLRARIVDGNKASRRAFIKAGYRCDVDECTLHM